MTIHEQFTPAECTQVTAPMPEGLVPGDVVEARRAGRLLHRGAVTDVAPHQGLLWIMDTLTGGRKLLDHSEVEISRVPEPEVQAVQSVPFPAAG